MASAAGSGGLGNPQVLLDFVDGAQWIYVDQDIALIHTSPQNLSVITVGTNGEVTVIQASDDVMQPTNNNTSLGLSPSNLNSTSMDDGHESGVGEYSGEEASDDKKVSDDKKASGDKNASVAENKLFTPFKKLPPELRVGIWELLLPAGRVIQLLEACNTQEQGALTLAATGSSHYFLYVPKGENHLSELTPLYLTNFEARQVTNKAYETKPFHFMVGTGAEATRLTTDIVFDVKVDKLLFAATGTSELKHLYASFDVFKLRHFALVVGDGVVKKKKKLLAMLRSVFKAMPSLKNLEVVVGPNWHHPFYEDAVKLIEIDEKFVNWVRDEHVWDAHGGLNELINIEHVVDLGESVESIWETFVDGQVKEHVSKRVKFKVCTTAWLLAGGSDVGMYQLRYQCGPDGHDPENLQAPHWHLNIGYADQETGEVEIPKRIIFPQGFPRTNENGIVYHNALLTVDTGDDDGEGDYVDNPYNTYHTTNSNSNSDADADLDADSDADFDADFDADSDADSDADADADSDADAGEENDL